MHITSSKLDVLLNVFLSLGIPGLDCMVMMEGKVVYRRTSGFSDCAGIVAEEVLGNKDPLRHDPPGGCAEKTSVNQ